MQAHYPADAFQHGPEMELSNSQTISVTPAALDIDTNKFRRQDRPGLDEFLRYASWSNQSWDSLYAWSCTSNLTVHLGVGSGQRHWPFPVSSEEFQRYCETIGFSELFLNALVAKAPLFEHRFVVTDASDVPTHLEIAMATLENDSFFSLLRYHIAKSEAKVIIFFKPVDHINRTPLYLSKIIAWLDSNSELLRRHPLMILGAFLSFMQFRAHEFLRWRLELNNMEARLGVTRESESLRQGGYSEISYDFTAMNADLAGLSKKIADSELSASILLEHGKCFQRLVVLCEDYEAHYKSPLREPATELLGTTEQREVLKSIVARGELYIKQSKMLQDVLTSLEAVLYNRINKQDTQSMKTIAIVSLVFLPTTFVSTIFATGIFNFHASDPPDNPRTISKYGWIYLLACILFTCLTLASWVCWHKWGRVGLEKLEFSHISTKEGDRSPFVAYSRRDSSGNMASHFHDIVAIQTSTTPRLRISQVHEMHKTNAVISHLKRNSNDK